MSFNRRDFFKISALSVGATLLGEKTASAKENEGLSYKQWGKRFNIFLKYVELLISPDYIILGGGTSKNFDEYKDYITIETPVIPAELRNQAGIVGAAAAALHEAPRD